MKQGIRLAIISAVVLASAGLGVFIARGVGEPPAAPVLDQGTAFPAPRALPAFALVDQDGKPFVPGSLRGHWSILFFGFTSCPDVCPTTLATLSQARRALADLPVPDQPTITLVSVDPGRDTPDKLKAYVEHFDPSFRAATGTREALDLLTGSMGVAVQVGEPDASGYYTIDHTAALFVVNPSGELVALLSSPHSPDTIATDYRRLLAAAE